MPVQTNKDVYLCGQSTREEMADDAREHYERLSLEAHCWYSLISKAIDAWEREPELLERIEGLEKELERLRKEDEAWDKHSLVQIVTERDDLRTMVEQLLKDARPASSAFGDGQAKPPAGPMLESAPTTS